ncbi:BON domain-containing protein [Actinoplanes sp. NPDC049596]|uniref:BON domain-containing protein n=1 Tax=unclassified Actinoplanes TaxID=2626549 RepID=UPI0034392301
MVHFFPEPPRPDEPAPADVRLARRVAGAVSEHGSVDVHVQNGVVMLTGVVRDGSSHDAVLRRVKAMPGVRDLCDGLEVSDGRIGPGRDAELFGTLAARLALRPAPRPRRRGTVAVAARAAVVTAAAGVVLVEIAGWLTILMALGVLALIADVLLRGRGR